MEAEQHQRIGFSITIAKPVIQQIQIRLIFNTSWLHDTEYADSCLLKDLFYGLFVFSETGNY